MFDLLQPSARELVNEVRKDQYHNFFALITLLQWKGVLIWEEFSTAKGELTTIVDQEWTAALDKTNQAAIEDAPPGLRWLAKITGRPE